MITKFKKEKLYSINIDEMYFEIAKLKHFDNNYAFPNLTKLVKIILSRPHSNAAAERIFSRVTDVKFKKRNRIGHDALNAVCVIRSSLLAKTCNCVNYKITKDRLKLHTYNMYSFKN